MSDLQFPLTLRVTVSGATPDELREKARTQALAFFGPDAELDVISAEAESDPKRGAGYQAVVVFRRVAL
ncbi:hypothetical protein [Nonomuraea aurantiaca]|jgi:hypothetical protein|uniref:hypothetical protein n=1 Tax=Nonomuraea aurantiaca TaxID=2878562 RepID=UPI001CD94537|nr:hypothetical protein [Nonomuraea aurantiaca]MCA2223623.1 hypothetical protein [Nonomuraea aurantiaca]